MAFQTSVHANQNINHWWVTLESGAAFTQNNSDTVVEYMPEVTVPDNYVTTHNDNVAILGLGAGYSMGEAKKNSWFPTNRLGIYYDYYFPATSSGHIEKYQNITAYTYKFKSHSNTLWLNDQLDLFNWCNIVPFIEFGFGPSWNTAYDYNQTPVAPNPLQDRRTQSAAFKNKTHTDLAWRTGVGVNFILSKNSDRFQIGVLYRYSDRGRAKTGSSANYPTVDKPLETKLRSNEVLGSLSYHF